MRTTSAIRRFASPGRIRALVPRPEGIGHGDVEIRPVERQVVVPAVPEQDIALPLRLLEDRAVVDARVDDRAGVDVRLVLLALLDRHPGPVEVLQRLEALDPLGDEVPYGIG